MSNLGVSANSGRAKLAAAFASAPSLTHYVQLILYRKWIVIGVFILTTAVTIGVVQTLPNVYTAQTVILVDPQQVPESYVRPTVTGTVRDRLSTLSQQILSATRLQKIIDTLHLYQAERKKLAREEIISQMRKDINTTIVSDFGASQSLQAFRITYSGAQPRLVAQVTNQLAQLFIEENLRAREQQSAGTTEFLQNQLEDARKALEEQEGKLRDFRMKHVGEMPEQQSATIQILGQLQSQAQLEGEALNRAQQQKTYLESMMTGTAPVVSLDPGEDPATSASAKTPAGAVAPVKRSTLDEDRAKLAEMLKHYKDTWPDVVKLKKQIQAEEARETAAGINQPDTRATVPVPPPPARAAAANPAANTTVAPIIPPTRHFNPVVQAQIEQCDVEIDKHKQEIQRLSKQIAGWQAKLEAIPVREQESMSLTRDYDMTKAHYAQLQSQALSAETATQLEFRQKGERFVILDPAVPPEKPSKPNRPLLDLGGAMMGFLLGLVLALASEIVGMTIIAPKDITSTGNLTILETIPVIMTQSDVVVRRRWVVATAASAVLATIAVGTLLFLRLRHLI